MRWGRGTRGGRPPPAVPPPVGPPGGAGGRTFFAYGPDKAPARSGRSRTPENTLHGLALVGGWPGAAIAQRALRHKNRKTSFLVVFWLTVLVNAGALAWLLSAAGRRLLETLPG